MPTYEYRCNSCGNKFEEFQSITAEPIKECPQCKGEIRRTIGRNVTFIFKGSGFYATDYRSESYTKREQKEKEGRKREEDGNSKDWD